MRNVCVRALLTVCALSPGALVQVGALEMHVLEWLEPLELNLKEILSSLGKLDGLHYKTRQHVPPGLTHRMPIAPRAALYGFARF